MVADDQGRECEGGLSRRPGERRDPYAAAHR
jgi:hypothetical protein